MEVKLLRYPIQHDWDRCKLLELDTEGKEAKTSATLDWKYTMLRCEHSPIRTLMFTIQLVDVPYWVSVHYVKSRLNDKQSEYDRNLAPQNAPVNHIIEVNAQELMFMARKRLCSKVAAEIKQVMQAIVDEVVKVCPEFKPFLVPRCEYLGRCPEMYGCGMYDDNQFDRVNSITGNEYQKLAMRTASGMNFDMVGGNGLLLNGVLGLNGEAGECIDLVKKHLFQGKRLDKEHLAKELGDVAWYLAVTAQSIGYGLDEIFKMNIKKLEARYPNGFEVQKSEHRKEGDI